MGKLTDDESVFCVLCVVLCREFVNLALIQQHSKQCDNIYLSDLFTYTSASFYHSKEILDTIVLSSKNNNKELLV